MIRPKFEEEKLLLSLTKKCETLIQQTHRKPGEALEFKMIKPRETFHLTPPVQIKGVWMIRLTDLEVLNSFLHITERNNSFELYNFPDEKAGGISYEKVKDGIERDLDTSVNTDTDLQDDILGLNIIEEYRGQVTKRMENEH